MLFLITNRVSDFDEAIPSRIYLMLKYDSLELYARKQVWRHFLHAALASQVGPVIARKEMDNLAITAFNSQQVILVPNVSGL